MLNVGIKNGAAAFSFLPTELQLLIEGVLIARSELCAPEREKDALLLETIAAAFQSALEVCILQNEQ